MYRLRPLVVALAVGWLAGFLVDFILLLPPRSNFALLRPRTGSCASFRQASCDAPPPAALVLPYSSIYL